MQFTNICSCGTKCKTISRSRMKNVVTAILVTLLVAPATQAQDAQRKRDEDTVKTEHGMIGLSSEKSSGEHTKHPDAQWFGDAAFGLFLHWDISSVRAMNI